MKDLEHITESNKEDNLKTLLINGSLMLGAFVLRQGIEAGYKMINGNSAPKKIRKKNTAIGQKHYFMAWLPVLYWALPK